MPEIRSVGMVIYTYGVIEENSGLLWDWLRAIEEWSGRPYMQFNFSSRAKGSRRVWKASPKNRERLAQQLAQEQPWAGLFLGWPTIHGNTCESGGLQIALVSEEQPSRELLSYRRPSFIFTDAHPRVLANAALGIDGLVGLWRQVWELVGAVYGFVDLEAGVGLHDQLFRNALMQMDNYVPEEYAPEFRAWQRISAVLEKRVWKAFWGNFLGPEHIRQIGGVQALRKADRLYRLLPEYQEQAYAQGIARLKESGGYYEWQDLPGGGVFLSLSASPLEWFEPEVQERRERLQEALGEVALGPKDWEQYDFRRQGEETRE